MSALAIYGTLVSAFLGTVGLIEFARRSRKNWKARQAAERAEFALQIATLMKATEEVHTAVTQNGNKNDPPTVPDRLHRIESHLVAQDLRMAASESKADHWRDEHRAWSDQKIVALTDRIRRLESRDE